MRVLYSRVQSRKDGSAIHSQELTDAFQELGVEVFPISLFLLEGGINASIADRSQMLNRSKVMPGFKKLIPRVAKELIVPLFSLRYVAEEVSRAQKIIDCTKPDIFLVRADYTSLNYLWLSNLIAWWKARQNNLPMVLEVNGPLVYEHQRFLRQSNYLYWDYPVLASIFEKNIWSRADAIVCISNQLRDLLLELGVTPTKISVIPNGVDLNKFSLSIGGERTRKKYDLDNKIVVGFVGSLRIWHGIDNLIKSLKVAVSKNSRIHCLIVGNLDDYPDIHSLINSQGVSDHVTLTGNIQHSSIPEHIAAMDITAVPYPNIERFYFSPIKMFEYMAMARPVIASRVGQIGEIIVHRHNGYLVEPGNFDELARGILELADDAEFRERIGKNARKTIEENYTWEKNAQAIRNIFETVLANRNY